MLLKLFSVVELPNAASAILRFSKDQKIFLFHGNMGAGKTTLIKSLCAALGVKDNVTSPTFSIVNEYQASGNQKVYHFDFYRLKNQTEALDMGYEEYFYSDAYCFVEWPEMIPDLLPDHYINIKISLAGNNSREIFIEEI